MPGTRMVVVQLRQRTVLPREECGTIRTRRHVRFGHMMRTFSSMGEPSGRGHRPCGWPS